MKKIYMIVLMIFVSSTAYAGSYTLNTTTAQDTKLATIADSEGFANVDALLQNIVITNITELLKKIDRNKRTQVRHRWESLSDAQKDAIATILNQ